MNFIKIVFGSCLGTILATGLVFFLSIGLISVIASSAGSENKKPLDKASFLEIRADKMYPEKTDNITSTGFSLDDKHLGLHDLLKAIEAASNDPKIKGILFRSGYSALGSSSAFVLNQSLVDFKKSGKPIYAYGDYFTEGSYHLASVADRIILNPNGMIELKGFGAMIPFFKELFDKTGITFDIYYAGQFKSATEPFRLGKMSDQNRSQTREYLEDLYQFHLADISKNRDIPVADLRVISNEYLSRSSEDAIKFKLADTLGYLDDAYRLIQQTLGISEKTKPSIVSATRYFESIDTKTQTAPISSGKIAILFAEGEIVDGEGNYGQVGSAKYQRLLRKIRQDDKIKALVLRVNSPGGSSLASDNILHEIQLIKQAGKPVVVSMGDFAASGGYYIACQADTIFAEPNTITGSIGVFFMIPNVSELLGDKIGIDIDTVRTGRFTTAFNPFMPWSSEEGIIAQKQTDMVYDRFLTVVAEGRNMTKTDVHEIAQGRVWSGQKAMSNGLVDASGGLEDAIQCAAQLAKLDEYRTTEFPAVKEPFLQWMERLTNIEPEMSESHLKKKFGAWYTTYKQITQWSTADNHAQPLMRLPFRISIQ